MSADGCTFHYDYPRPYYGLGPACQFTDETEFFACDDQSYCRFHLPLADKEGKPTQKGERKGLWVQDFQATITRLLEPRENATYVAGPNLSGVVLPGKIDLSERDLTGVLWYRAVFHERAIFENVRFEDADFKDAKFSGRACFKGAKFTGEAYFANADFSSGADFRDADFSVEADFSKASFSDLGADFSDADFSGRTLFRDAKFSGAVEFQDADFSGSAYFSDAEFTGDADFSDAEFSGGAYFRDAKFSGAVEFQDADFSGSADFSDAEFTGDADLSDAEFSGGAYFRNAKFSGGAYFKDVDFSGGAYFSDANFSGAADFRDADFSGDADFGKAAFSGDADFRHTRRVRRASVQGKADEIGAESTMGEEPPAPQGAYFPALAFTGATVGGVANFNNRIFNEPADFSGRTFAKAPEFHGCQLHQGTRWLSTGFMERSGDNAERAYRTLRLAMEQIRDRPQEAIFFALEQEAMRNNRDWWDLRRWFSLAYDWSCGYGDKLGRPLLWLVATTAMFFVLYWIIGGGRDPTIDAAQAIATFCIQQIVRPFWIWGGSFPDPAGLLGDPLSFWIKLLATLQSILSLAFIGLFILVLRWQFRRG